MSGSMKNSELHVRKTGIRCVAHDSVENTQGESGITILGHRLDFPKTVQRRSPQVVQTAGGKTETIAWIHAVSAYANSALGESLKDDVDPEELALGVTDKLYRLHEIAMQSWWTWEQKDVFHVKRPGVMAFGHPCEWIKPDEVGLKEHVWDRWCGLDEKMRRAKELSVHRHPFLSPHSRQDKRIRLFTDADQRRIVEQAQEELRRTRDKKNRLASYISQQMAFEAIPDEDLFERGLLKGCIYLHPSAANLAERRIGDTIETLVGMLGDFDGDLYNLIATVFDQQNAKGRYDHVIAGPLPFLPMPARDVQAKRLEFFEAMQKKGLDKIGQLEDLGEYYFKARCGSGGGREIGLFTMAMRWHMFSLVREGTPWPDAVFQVLSVAWVLAEALFDARKGEDVQASYDYMEQYLEALREAKELEDPAALYLCSRDWRNKLILAGMFESLEQMLGAVFMTPAQQIAKFGEIISEGAGTLPVAHGFEDDPLKGKDLAPAQEEAMGDYESDPFEDENDDPFEDENDDPFETISDNRAAYAQGAE